MRRLQAGCKQQLTLPLLLSHIVSHGLPCFISGTRTGSRQQEAKPVGRVPATYTQPAYKQFTSAAQKTGQPPSCNHQRRQQLHSNPADSKHPLQSADHHLPPQPPQPASIMAQTPPLPLTMTLFEQAAPVIVQHTGAATRKALFSLCRAGRDTVLRTAPSATLQLDTTTAAPGGDAWLSQLAAAKHALLTRGRQPTTLALLVKESIRTDGGSRSGGVSGPEDDQGNEALPAIPEQLGEACAHITEFSIRCPGARYWHHPHNGTKTALTAVVAAFSSVQRISCVPFAFPTPQQLPSLTGLAIACVSREQETDCEQGKVEFNHDIAAFMPQLSSFESDAEQAEHDDGYEVHQYPWGALFCKASTSHTLHTFKIQTPLTDDLLGLLVDHAPALRHLGVCGLRLYDSKHAKAEWGVQTLDVGQGKGYDGDYRILGSELGCLPVSTAKQPMVIQGSDVWQVILCSEVSHTGRHTPCMCFIPMNSGMELQLYLHVLFVHYAAFASRSLSMHRAPACMVPSANRPLFTGCPVT